MKTIYKSVLITILTALVLLAGFVILGLLLNFWNETIYNASIALIGSLLIGCLSFAGLSVLISEPNNYR
tara:strand:+ start:2067 stop:2273 length:207 start_codon:yes stop_codon:yes gene_type:complete